MKNDAADSFGSLMMELDNLNILNEAVAALNTPEDSLILHVSNSWNNQKF